MMMVCILFNYACVRSIKDGLCVSYIGAEAVSFLKTYVVLPCSMLMMMGYMALCNIMSPKGVF